MLYAKNTANYPRLVTDCFWADYNNEVKYEGFMDSAYRFTEEKQLLRTDLWERFVYQFKSDSDIEDNGWRGEYWGKMMRGACFVYSYTRNPGLYQILKNTVEDIMTAQDELGRISSYSVEYEYRGWDVWSRKYVLLGMQYFLEICEDEKLAERVIDSMCRQMDYFMSKVGRLEEGKLPITRTSVAWRGLNATSILEPVVRLYSLTGKREYLDYATYIVESGGIDVEKNGSADCANIFELAYKNQLYPYQYPITKAYEMTSCFEGLLEYYRVTGNEKYKTAVINYANKVLESDFTIIGSAGCTHELFDHSTVRQANTNNGIIAQETCVTVTLMKFFYQMTLLTGNARYVDAFEQSLYNAYLGAFNTEAQIEEDLKERFPDLIFEALPFDSYSPLTAGRRGERVGGRKIMSDNHYYGCCACIGSAGIGLVNKIGLLTTQKGFAMNLYIAGSMKTSTESGNEVIICVSTDYPVSGRVKITVEPARTERFELLLRNPGFSKNTKVSVNGEEVKDVPGYIALEREWIKGDVIELSLDMRTEAIYPISYGNQIVINKSVYGPDHMFMIPVYDEEDPIAKNHIALRRGPVILAQENRLGYCVDDPVTVVVGEEGCVDVAFPEEEIAPYEHILEVTVPLADGRRMHVTDYASAGKIWNDEGRMAAWFLTE